MRLGRLRPPFSLGARRPEEDGPAPLARLSAEVFGTGPITQRPRGASCEAMKDITPNGRT